MRGTGPYLVTFDVIQIAPRRTLCCRSVTVQRTNDGHSRHMTETARTTAEADHGAGYQVLIILLAPNKEPS